MKRINVALALSITIVSLASFALSAKTVDNFVGKYDLVEQSGKAYVKLVCPDSIVIEQGRHDAENLSSKNLRLIALNSGSDLLTGNVGGNLNNIDGKIKNSRSSSVGFGEDNYHHLVSSVSENDITLTQHLVRCSMGAMGMLFGHTSCDAIDHAMVERIYKLSNESLTIALPLNTDGADLFKCRYIRH